MAGDAIAVQEIAYHTIERDGSFELRQIEPHFVVETFVSGDFESVGKEGFGRSRYDECERTPGEWMREHAPLGLIRTRLAS